MMLTIPSCFALAASVSAARFLPQEPLKPNRVQPADFDLIYELKKAEIIPTVIDAFKPLLTVNVNWSDATAEYGNTVDPAKVQDTPEVAFVESLPDSLWARDDTPQLTLALTDPDAPSRDDPEWSEICHWIATSIPLTSAATGSKGHLTEVMPYKPPGPPPETGKHRYVFVALAPVNGTSERLHLSKPGDRQHWGYKHERQGLRMWAEEMGLGVVGANFIYAQNDEQ